MFVIASSNQELYQKINFAKKKSYIPTICDIEKVNLLYNKMFIIFNKFGNHTELSISHYFLNNISPIISFTYNIDRIAKKIACDKLLIRYCINTFCGLSVKTKKKGSKIN